MKTITNIIHPLFNKDAIEADFDFFQIKTERKYFSKGSRLLDIRQEGIAFNSVVFENGRSIYCFCRKGQVSSQKLFDAINDGTNTVKNVSCFEMEDRILLKLFLYSLNCPNGEGASFNNLTGRFYIYLDGLKSVSKTLKVLSVDIDKKMGLQITATSFTSESQFPKEKIREEPRYVFSHEHLSFKRVYESIKGETVYVRKTRFGRKTEVPFLRFNKPEQRLTKSYWAYKTLRWLSEEYSEYLSINLREADITKKVTVRRDRDFVDKAINTLSRFPCNVVNLVGEDNEGKTQEIAETLTNRLGFQVGEAAHISKEAINFCLIHNKEYYEQNNEKDPQNSFPKDVVVQCIAIEDGFVKIAKDNGSVIDTIIKEAAIKTDIVHLGIITLDSWPLLGYEDDWTFLTTNNGFYYAMIVHRDGSFDFKTAKDDFVVFNDKGLNDLSLLISGNNESAQTVVKDSLGNTCLITGTAFYSLPNENIFMSPISRSKESRDKYLAGIVDINVFELDKHLYYNAGIVGSGMNTDVSKAAPYYSVDVVKGVEIITQLLETMSVMFVKLNSFTVLPYPFKYLREYVELNNH